jgi:hypothetical protein
VVFEGLKKEQIRRIVRIQAERVRERLAAKKIKMVLDDSAIDYLGVSHLASAAPVLPPSRKSHLAFGAPVYPHSYEPRLAFVALFLPNFIKVVLLLLPLSAPESREGHPLR